MQIEAKYKIIRIPSTVNIRTAPSLSETVVPSMESGNKLEVHTLVFKNGHINDKLFLEKTTLDSIGIIPPETPNAFADVAIDRTHKDSRKNHLYVASDEMAERLSSQLPETSVLGSSQVRGLIKDEAYRKYGANFPSQETAGTYHLGAFIIDRLVLSRIRGRAAELNHVFTDNEGIITPPTKQAEVLAKTPQTLYVQKINKSPHVSPSSHDGSGLFYATRTLEELEPSDDVLAKRQLLDHVPFSTGNNQGMITLITASEWSQALRLPLGQVLEMMGAEADNTEESSRDYRQLLKVVEQELHLKGKRLIEARTEDFQAINARIRENPHLGQLLPPLYTLLKEELIDLDQVRKVEKELHSRKFSGIPKNTTEFMPSHMVKPGAEDTPSIVAHALDKVIQNNRMQPDTGIVGVKTDGLTALATNGKRQREGDLQAGKEERRTLDEQNQSLYIYNREKRHLEEMPEIADAAREFIRDNEIPIILPAFVEPTAWDVARAASELSPGKVILASPDQRTLAEAAPYAFAIDQNEVFKFLDIQKLREMGIIPQGREVPLRGKGMTILAGWLWGMAHGHIKPGQYVGHVDTDIINMDKESVYYKRDKGESEFRRPYRPLEYMAAALAQMPASHRAVAVQPAKVGPPRKGEVKHPTFQAFMNAEDPFLRNVGLGLGRVVWPSPGEGIVLSDLYTKGPWQVTTGFDLDRYFKAVVWEIKHNGELEENDMRDVFAQVIVPPDKIENGSVPEKNDWAEVNWATTLFTHALEFYQNLDHEQRTRSKLAPFLQGLSQQQIQALPKELREGLAPALAPSFTIDHIIAFNAKYAGTQDRVISSESPESERDTQGGIIYPANEVYKGASGPNGATHRWNPWYLPSVEWMVENNIVDLDGIKNNVEHISPTRVRGNISPPLTRIYQTDTVNSCQIFLLPQEKN